MRLRGPREQTRKIEKTRLRRRQQMGMTFERGVNLDDPIEWGGVGQGNGKREY